MIFMIVALGACQSDAPKPSEKSMTVHLKQSSQTVTLSGWLQPSKVIAVTSPVDALVTKITAPIGTRVKQGQLLYQLSSDNLDSSVFDQLSSYLINREKDTISTQQLAGSKQLYQAGLLSRNDYQSRLIDAHNQRINTLKSQRSLVDLASRYHFSLSELTQISLDDLLNHHNKLISHPIHLDLKAPMDGQMLPAAFNTMKSEASNRLFIGQLFKQGDVLAVVADTQRLAVALKVSQFDIHRLKPGQSATLTSNAFSEVLNGKVSEISQSDITPPSDNNKVTFPVTVSLDTLSAKQAEHILVGMSVDVRIHTGQNRVIQIPIDAIEYRNDHYHVKVIDPEGKVQSVEVTPGTSTAQLVTILKGLKDGDRIVLP